MVVDPKASLRQPVVGINDDAWGKHMKAGMILGIIGGVLALLVGAIGHTASSTLGSWAGAIGYGDGESQMRFYSIMSLLLPILGLIGGGIAGRNAMLGGGLMAVSAAGILWVFGVGIFSIICAGLLGVGAILVFADGGAGSAPKG